MVHRATRRFYGDTVVGESVDRETVSIEPPTEIVDEATEWYEREQPEGARTEMIEQRVLDLVDIEVVWDDSVEVD